jgi:hypothetical protein
VSRENRAIRIVGIGLVAGVALGGLAYAALQSITSLAGDCDDVILNEVRSPDLHWKAVSYERNCGATTGYVTHVNVLSSAVDFGGQDEGRVLTIEGKCAVDVRWRGRTLVLRYASTCEVFRRVAQWKSVNVEFETSNDSEEELQ